MHLPSVALLALAAFASAGAQQDRPRAVPYEFALAILGTDPAPGAVQHAPQLLVGGLAPDLRAIPAPLNGRVIGSVAWTTSSIGFYQVTAPPDSVRIAYAATLHAAGWDDPPRVPPSPEGGFRDAPHPPTLLAFCRDSAVLYLRYLPTEDGGTRVRIQRRSGVRGAPCHPRPVQYAVAGERPPTFPLLVTPGAKPMSAMDSCFGRMGRDGPGTGHTFVSDATPAAMVANYATQLVDSGWHATPTTTGEVVMQRFTKLDSLGRERRLTVTVSSPPGFPACREAMMYLLEPD